MISPSRCVSPFILLLILITNGCEDSGQILHGVGSHISTNNWVSVGQQCKDVTRLSRSVILVIATSSYESHTQLLLEMYNDISNKHEVGFHFMVLIDSKIIAHAINTSLRLSAYYTTRNTIHSYVGQQPYTIVVVDSNCNILFNSGVDIRRLDLVLNHMENKATNKCNQ
jgi:hypothetical protein